jgi:hypothetical protein
VIFYLTKRLSRLVGAFLGPLLLSITPARGKRNLSVKTCPTVPSNTSALPVLITLALQFNIVMIHPSFSLCCDDPPPSSLTASASPRTTRGQRPTLTREDENNARQSVLNGTLLGAGTLGIGSAGLTVWGLNRADDIRPRYDANSRKDITSRPTPEQLSQMVEDSLRPTRDLHMDGTKSIHYTGSEPPKEIAERMRGVRAMMLENFGIQRGHIGMIDQLPNPARQKIYRTLTHRTRGCP